MILQTASPIWSATLDSPEIARRTSSLSPRRRYHYIGLAPRHVLGGIVEYRNSEIVATRFRQPVAGLLTK
jgi:hypothetical protein